jgi:hypothetical protein
MTTEIPTGGIRRRALTRFFLKQVVQVAAFLMWPQKSNRHFAAGTDLRLQSLADFSQGEVVA